LLCTSGINNHTDGQIDICVSDITCLFLFYLSNQLERELNDPEAAFMGAIAGLCAYYVFLVHC
jgi:hypothetical protein